MIEQTRLPTKQIGTRYLETRHMANTIHIGRGRLWGEIRWRGTCPSSQKHTQGTLQTHMQLDRNRIHRDHIGLGLQKTPGAFVDAKLCEESLETIPTHCRQTTALTLSERTNSIWCQEAICNAGIDCTFAPNASFNKYAANSYSLAEQWTAPYFAQSAPSHPNRQNRPQIQCSKHFNSLII